MPFLCSFFAISAIFPSRFCLNPAVFKSGGRRFAWPFGTDLRRTLNIRQFLCNQK